MSLSTMLNVAIGLVLLYYVLSLIVSYITSNISRWLQMRANDLEHVLRERLQDPAMFADLMHHPLIKNLQPMRVTWGGKVWEAKVTDIPASTFVTALFDLLAPENNEQDKLTYIKDVIKQMPEGDVKTSLSCLIDSTVQDIQTAREKLENWYNNVVKNASLLYTQHARYIAIICALVVSIGIDADSLAIANRLWNEPTIRAAAAIKATDYVNRAPNPEQADVIAYITDLQELKLPILWSAPLPQNANGWFLKVLGWIITWIAVAQGSSFWYDVLKRVRSATTDTSSKPAAM